MAVAEDEVSLAQLAAKFSDSDGEDAGAAQAGPKTVEASTAEPAAAGDAAGAQPALSGGSGSELDAEEEDDWDSEDDDELGLALDWADMSEGV